MAEILDLFAYHKPNEEETARIERIREAYSSLFQYLQVDTRPGSVSGRYMALAKTALEESAMWATKSIVFERDNDPNAPVR